MNESGSIKMQLKIDSLNSKIIHACDLMNLLKSYLCKINIKSDKLEDIKDEVTGSLFILSDTMTEISNDFDFISSFIGCNNLLSRAGEVEYSEYFNENTDNNVNLN